MLRIQLDDARCSCSAGNDLLLQLLDADAIACIRAARTSGTVLLTWNGHASVDSGCVSARRGFRDRTERSVWKHAHGRAEDSGGRSVDDCGSVRTCTVAAGHAAADASAGCTSCELARFLLEQLDLTIADLEQSCGTLAQCTWGLRNTIAIRHPFRRVATDRRLLDMPTVQLPGDNNMTRVQDGEEGASERFAVSPGHESEVVLSHAGRPERPSAVAYYRAGFLAWAHGEPLPFLPGPAEHTLTLQGN